MTNQIYCDATVKWNAKLSVCVRVCVCATLITSKLILGKSTKQLEMGIVNIFSMLLLLSILLFDPVL